MIITTHPENWSNEKQVTARLFAADNELHMEMYDYDFRIVPHKVLGDGDDYDYFSMKVYMEKEQEFPSVVVSKFRKDKQWQAFNGEIREGVLSRQAADPIEAVMKVIANVV